MSATVTEKTRFLRKLNATTADFADTTIDDIFNEMEARYASYSRDVIFAAAKVEGVDNLLMAASKRTTYSQGASSESLTDVFRNLEKMREKFQKELEDLLTDEGVPIHWGSMKKIPTRTQDWPDD